MATDHVAALLEFAELAEACGRYSDMLGAAVAAANLSCGADAPAAPASSPWRSLLPVRGRSMSGLTERVPTARCISLLARAAKLAVSTTRGPLRMLDVLNDHEPDERLRSIALGYRAVLAREAAGSREEVVQCLEAVVLPTLEAAADDDSGSDDGTGRGLPAAGAQPRDSVLRCTVSACRLLGDAYRYAAEAAGPGTPAASEAGAVALSQYSKAQQLAARGLPAWSPVRLAASLNLSVFLFERHGDEAGAARVAKEAVDAGSCAPASAAEAEAEGGEAAEAESARLLGLLRENLEAWRRVLRVDRLVV